MTEREADRHPLLVKAMDRRLPLEERRAAYAQWADEHKLHRHPGQPAHSHAGGHLSHSHEGGER